MLRRSATMHMGTMQAAKSTHARFSGRATRPYKPAMAAAQAARQASVITWKTRFMRGNCRSMSRRTRAKAKAAAVCRQTEKLCSRTAARGLSRSQNDAGRPSELANTMPSVTR